MKLVEDVGTKKRFAMKVINKKMLMRRRIGPGQTALDDVKREIAIMKKLDHPNVVKVLSLLGAAPHHWPLSSFTSWSTLSTIRSFTW